MLLRLLVKFCYFVQCPTASVYNEKGESKNRKKKVTIGLSLLQAET